MNTETYEVAGFEVLPKPEPRKIYDELSPAQQRKRWSGTNPCNICGRELSSRNTWTVLGVDGGAALARVEDWKEIERDRAEDYEVGYMGAYEVGSTCARRIPAAFKRQN